jgi:predicted lipid-binding transport protein (Tim44 family)
MRGANWRFWGLCACAGVLSILTGCASVTHGTTQSIKIETLTPGGQVVDGAECKVANDKGEALALSGQSVPVRRSGGNLSIQCTQAGQAPAGGQAVSRVNGGMVGNILIGGLIGVAIDAGNGSGFNYPSWMQLVFGEQRYFDRGAQQGDQAMAGVMLGTTQAATATPVAAAPRKEPESPADRIPPAPQSAAEPVPVARAPAAPAPSPGAAPPARVSMDDLNALLPAKT